jgi:hypothetical protein
MSCAARFATGGGSLNHTLCGSRNDPVTTSATRGTLAPCITAPLEIIAQSMPSVCKRVTLGCGTRRESRHTMRHRDHHVIPSICESHEGDRSSHAARSAEEQAGCEGHHAARGRTSLGRGRPTRVTWLGGLSGPVGYRASTSRDSSRHPPWGPTPSRHETPRSDNLLAARRPQTIATSKRTTPSVDVQTSRNFSEPEHGRHWILRACNHRPCRA